MSILYLTPVDTPYDFMLFKQFGQLSPELVFFCLVPSAHACYSYLSNHQKLICYALYPNFNHFFNEL